MLWVTAWRLSVADARCALLGSGTFSACLSRLAITIGIVYISLSRLRVEVDRSDELVAAFGQRAGLVESHDGFVDLQVWRSDRDPAEVLMVSRWRDKDAFREYMKSNDHRVSHDRMDPLLRHAVKLERLESMHTYDVVAE